MKTKQLIRESFRNAVFSRDKYKCRVCGKSGKLDAHHITDRNEMPNGGYTASNGVSLCETCHFKAEMYHRGLMVEKGFLPDDLYVLIDSSKEKAYKDSLNL